MKAPRFALMFIVFLAGFAALTWELVWQVKATLALGVSAYGTAITLATTMGGMTVGSLVCGSILSRREQVNPFRLYAALEIVIAASGLLLVPAFQFVAQLDRAAYQTAPWLAPILHLLAIALVLGPPTIAMGATLPTFQRFTEALENRVSISLLYGLNTLGAAFGVLLAAFAVIPALGIGRTIYTISALNLFVALIAILLASRLAPVKVAKSDRREVRDVAIQFSSIVTVFTTGFATFGLEVAWFRAMRSAFQSTTESFAIILASVLIPLALAANMTSRLRKLPLKPGHYLVGAGVAILVITPLMERLDYFAEVGTNSYWVLIISWFTISLLIISAAIVLLGVPLPWLLEEASSAKECGRLYALNTVGAIAGAVLTAWLFLPSIGFAAASWCIGVATGLVGAFCLAKPQLAVSIVALLVSFLVAFNYETGIGNLRVQGLIKPHRVLMSEEGPDFTVSVIQNENASRTRELIIDGFRTAGENPQSNYMEWMGRLPMIAHPNPQNALVICFGTGQTANAVRLEGPAEVDIVELSQSVLDAAELFETNGGVLDDPDVHPIVMDGRAWLRRTDKKYDIVTLEPMPPFFAGSNALYSTEFYELINSRLNEGGVVAQWMPLHLLTPYYASSVANSFVSVFPNSVLWVDPNPQDLTGIIVGTPDPNFQWTWPGLDRESAGRTLSNQQVLDSVLLTPESIPTYVGLGNAITDDNQLLSFGGAKRNLFDYGFGSPKANLRVILQAAAASQAQRKAESEGEQNAQ